VDEMTISADGSRVVAVSGSRGGGPLGATVLDMATWTARLPPTLPPGRDATVALSPDGRRAYFAYQPPEPAAGSPAPAQPAPAQPAPAQPPVLAVDLDTGARTEIPVPAEGFAALRGVRRMAVSPDGRRLYAATAATVSVIDTGTNAVLGSAPAGVGVTGLAVSPSGRYLFASSSADRAVHVYDVAGGGPPREVGRASGVGDSGVGGSGVGGSGGAPDHLSMAPDGGHLYLSGPTGLSTVDTARFR
jgi:YVTN family beta-propeller protein